MDEDPEVRTATISADCPAGAYTLRASISNADNKELASATAGFYVLPPPTAVEVEEPEQEEPEQEEPRVARQVVELEFALHSDNSDPRGMWSDGTTLWVADETDRKFYAYTLEGGSRDTTKEFNLDSDNSRAEGVWSNGTTIWVSDPGDDKLYAYTLEGGSRDTAKEFDLVDGTPFSTNSNSNPSGIGSDGTTIWVADNNDDKFYAYTLEGGSPGRGQGFQLR